MFIDTIIWLYALIAFAVIILLLVLKNLAEVKVWIGQRTRPGSPMTVTTYLKMDGDGSAGEVRFPGGGSMPAIGRVIVDKQAGKEHGFVEVVTTDISDETQTPSYKQVGYISFHEDNVIDKYGYIYRQKRGDRKKELIGYCARPSAPDVPTIYGERTWRTLWLKCTLNAYLGLPAGVTPSVVNQNDKVERLFNINDEKDDTKTSEDADNVVEPVVDASAASVAETVASSDEEVVAVSVEPVEEDTIDEPIDEPVEDNTAEEVAVEEPETAADESAIEESAAEPTSEPVDVVPVEESGEATDESGDETAEAEAEEEPKKKDKKKKEKKEKSKKVTKEAFASAYYYGFHSSAKDYLPAEARACAYAFLSGNVKKRKYSEFYKNQPYGWKDTALLSSIIYSLLFIVLYTVNTGVFQMPLLGNDYKAVFILIACYYLLWAIVRMVKIERIESSNSFQKKLDLLNKNLGLKGFNFAIIILGVLAMYFSLVVYDFDLIPLIWAIIFGVAINMSLKGANTSWIISTTYNEKDEEDDDEEVQNPVGDIQRNYEWDLDKTYSTQQLHGSLTLYFTAQEIADLRQCNPFFTQRKDKSDKEYILDMFNFLAEHSHFNARIKYITKYINDTINKNNLTPLDKIQFTLDFIQEPNIRFVKNKDAKATNYYENYIRYPNETLYDKEGDCNSKSLLAAVMFHTMGFNVMYLASRKYEHAAIGIEIPKNDIQNGWYGSNVENLLFTENGKSYIFCETTGDFFRIGRTINGMSLDDFEEKLLIEVESTSQEETDYGQSKIYNWDLTSYYGNKLHGNLAIKFSEEEVGNLRGMNPFSTYGYDSNTYEDNVHNMFRILHDTPTLNKEVETVAMYIRREVEKAGFPEFDMAQFALNFAQTPNIVYRVDEECASIDFAKEYMRYPSETLFDKEGDCDCKSFLAANILHCLGYNVIFLLSQKLKHAAFAVECKDEWLDVIPSDNVDNVVMEHNGCRYIYCESTGEGNMIGCIKDGESIKDFEKIVDLSV